LNKILLKKIVLNSCDKEELAEFVTSLGEKPYRASQMFKWLHGKRCRSLDEMSDLPKDARQKLAEISEILTITKQSEVLSPKDDSIKVLFTLSDGERIESVILTDGKRVTGCISTQVGCRMGCKFCATAKIGFRRNLSSAEIVEQVNMLEQITLANKFTTEGRLTNIVFMGMGEPLDNFENVRKSLLILMDDNGYGYSHRRITVSTAGIVGKMTKLFSLDTPVNLAVSLNAPNQEIRKEIMPVAVKYHLKDMIDELKCLPVDRRKKIMLEYVLIKGVNDSRENALELVSLIKKLPVKINLIRYNSGGDIALKPPSEQDVLDFQKVLTANSLPVFIRKSMGSDISGACGQLAAGYKETLI
jgi:23S rRNA (adenine2503-C2)-methyltransferase